MRALALLGLLFLAGCAASTVPQAPWPNIRAAVPLLRIVQHPSGLFVWCTECPTPTPKTAPAILGLAWFEDMAIAGSTAHVLAAPSASNLVSTVSSADPDEPSRRHESSVPALVAQSDTTTRR